jgi:hypothetical protein
VLVFDEASVMRIVVVRCVARLYWCGVDGYWPGLTVRDDGVSVCKRWGVDRGVLCDAS